MKIKDKFTRFNYKFYYMISFVVILSLMTFLQMFININKNDFYLIGQEQSTPQEHPDSNLYQIQLTPVDIQAQQGTKTENDQNNSSLTEFNTLSYNVVLEPLHHTIISAEVNTPVLQINKRMGDSFEANEILMELDSRVFVSNYLKGLSAVRKFQTELKAAQELYKDDALSLFELDEAYANLAGAEADLQLAKKLLGSTKVKVPYKGKVVKISIQEYELAQQGKELIELVNSDLLYARFLVSSTLLSCLQPGATVHIFINEVNDWIESKISRIAPVIDPSSSTIKVEAEIDNREGKLWAGMTGSAKIEKCQKEESKLP